MTYETSNSTDYPTLAPGDWRGPDISVEDFRDLLGAAEIDALTRVAMDESLAPPALPSHQTDEPSIVGLLDRIRAALTPGTGRGFIVLSGLEAEKLSEAQWSRLYWGLGCALGRPVTQSKNADFIGHVRLVPDGSAYRGYSSRRGGTYHCDYTAVAGLLCLQQGKSGGESTLASLAAVHNIIRQENPELLSAAYSSIPFGRLKEQSTGEPGYSMQQIFDRQDGVFGGFYNRTLIQQSQEEGAPRLTDTQIALLDKIDEVAARESVRLDFLLEPGEILLLSNFMVLHGRTTFEDYDDPARWRHLLRLWLEVEEIERVIPGAVQYDYHYGQTGIRAGSVAS